MRAKNLRSKVAKQYRIRFEAMSKVSASKMRKQKYITNLVVRNRVAESWKSRSISRKEEPSPSMDRESMEGDAIRAPHD